MKYLKPIATGTLIVLLVLDLLLRLERPAIGQGGEQIIGFSVVSVGGNLIAYALTTNNRIYESQFVNRTESYWLKDALLTGQGIAGSGAGATITKGLTAQGISPNFACSTWQPVQTWTEAQQTDAMILQRQR